jgi:ABC-2 type transport system permease protein
MIDRTLVASAVRMAFRVRGSFVGPLTFLAVTFAVEGSFWYSVSAEGSVGDYTRSGIIFYAFLALIASQVVTCVGEPDQLPEKIETGLLDAYLLRPRHFLSQMGSIQLGNCLARVMVFLPLALASDLILRGGTAWTSQLYLFVLLPLAGLINYLINQILYTLTFYFRQSYAFVAAKETLFWVLSGALIPLDLFPLDVQSLLKVFPPAYVTFLPVKVALGDAAFLEVLVGQVAMIGVLAAVALGAWRIGVRHYQAYGG